MSSLLSYNNNNNNISIINNYLSIIFSDCIEAPKKESNSMKDAILSAKMTVAVGKYCRFCISLEKLYNFRQSDFIEIKANRRKCRGAKNHADEVSENAEWDFRLEISNYRFNTVSRTDTVEHQIQAEHTERTQLFGPERSSRARFRIAIFLKQNRIYKHSSAEQYLFFEGVSPRARTGHVRQRCRRLVLLQNVIFSQAMDGKQTNKVQPTNL